MKEKQSLIEEQLHDQLADCITYLLAGLEGHTSGNQITSIAVQQVGLSGWRVVTRAIGFDDNGDSIYVVGFTIGDSPGTALLLAERGYRDNLIQWKIDRFAKSLSHNGDSKNEHPKLVLTN